MKKSLRGFTLVEVLIGLTLLGLILAMLFSGLHTTSRSWTAGDTQAQINDDYRLVLSFIRRQISEAVPLSFIDGKDNYAIFQGEEESLHLVAPLPAHRGGAGLYVISFYLTENDGRSTFELSYQPVQPDSDWFDKTNEQIKKQTLIDLVSSIEFSYYGSEKEDDEPRWHNNWKEQERLPELVRLQIHSKQDTWPELTMHIRAKTERGQPQLTLIRLEPKAGV